MTPSRANEQRRVKFDADTRQRALLRRQVYAIMIAVALGHAAGQILAVNSVNRTEFQQAEIARETRALQTKLSSEGRTPKEISDALAAAAPAIEAKQRRERPFLSSNDRSRWLAIRALVEHGQFEIDPLLDQHVWNTIDMVQHLGRDGKPHLYSSKPPLLYVLLAGEYWLIERLTGMTLGTHPYEVGRLMLMTWHLPILGLMLAMVAGLIERFGDTDWGRLFTMTVAACGTLLTPFANTLNNHLPAATCAAAALYAMVRILYDRDQRLRWHVLAGLSAAFAAANEMPALAVMVGCGIILTLRDWRGCLTGYLPAASLVAVAFFATNYAAHQSFRPPYMHRSSTDPNDNWYAYRYTLNGRERASYWLDPQGMDRGEPSRANYALHALVGHHGIFSLTPVWLLSLAGLGYWLCGQRADRRALAVAIAALSLICLVFYIGLRPQVDRNYGGMTNGFRWMFWFSPLWLTAMLPTVDRLGRWRWGQALALALLAFSVLSASYPTWNPWTQPWIYNWMKTCGWGL